MKVRLFSQSHDSAYLLLFIKNPIQEFLLTLIDPDDIYKIEDETKGLEKDPHITILGGLPKGLNYQDLLDQSELNKVIPEIILTKISVFDNEEYDVLKFDAVSDQITQAVNNLKDYIPGDQEYHMHQTIAYLKKGTGSKYEHMFGSITNLIVEPKRLTFSDVGPNELNFSYI